MADTAHDDQADLAEPDALPVEEPEGSRPGRFLAGLFGGITLVGGLTWILINLQAPDPLVDVVVGVVLAVGGLILLMPHRVHLPAKASWLIAVATGLAGSAAGALIKSSYTCCGFAYVEERGFPFRWLSHGGVADDPETARRLAAADGWHADVPALLVNVVGWAYLGILIFALAGAVRRVRSRR